jgi:hypothetical protein
MGMNDTAVEHALDGHRLPHDHGIGVLAARPEIDQRMTAPVIEDELVAEYLGNGAFHGSGISVPQRGDSDRLQEHHVPRPPALGKLDAGGACRSADGKNGERGSRQQAVTRTPSRGRGLVRLRERITFTHGWLLSSG